MFNSNARWDRQLPGGEHAQCHPLEVFAKFSQGKIHPQVFVLNGVRYLINTINYTWSERQGRNVHRYFSVADTSDTYCLCLDTERMVWLLVDTGNS